MKISLISTIQNNVVATGILGLTLLTSSNFAVASPAYTQIAKNKKSDVSVFVKTDNKAWCQPNIELIFQTPNVLFLGTYEHYDFANKLATIMVHECPTITKFTVHAQTPENEEVILLAGMSKTDDWKIRPIESEKIGAGGSQPATKDTVLANLRNLAQAPTDINQKAPVAPHPEPASLEELYNSIQIPNDTGTGGSINLIGDWQAEVTCDKGGSYEKSHNVVLSIYKQNGEEFDGILFSQDIFGNFKGQGYYIDGVNQFIFKKNQTLLDAHHSNGSEKWEEISAQYNSDKDTLFPINTPKDCTINTFSHIDTTPVTYRQLMHSWNFAELAVKLAQNRKFGNTILGKEAPEESGLRFPSCQGYVEWSKRFSLNQRLIITGTKPSLLAHFQDSVFKHYFGTPAYYLDEDQFYKLNSNLSKQCSQVLPTNEYHVIDTILSDKDSLRSIRDRKEVVQFMTDFAPTFIKAGLTDEELFSIFSSGALFNIGCFFESGRGGNLDGYHYIIYDHDLYHDFRQHHTPNDVSILKDEVARYKDFYSNRIKKN